MRGDQHLLACIDELVDDEFDQFRVDAVLDLVKEHETVIESMFCENRDEPKHAVVHVPASVVIEKTSHPRISLTLEAVSIRIEATSHRHAPKLRVCLPLVSLPMLLPSRLAPAHT